jgi:hypothetical protein
MTTRGRVEIGGKRLATRNSSSASSAPRSFLSHDQEYAMSKTQQSNKEPKKQALLTPKEKKAAKMVKKHAGDVVPMVIKHS